MAMVAITKQGLVTIAILVAVLWGCLVSERLTVQKADAGMSRTLREMREQRAKARQDHPAGTAHKRGTAA